MKLFREQSYDLLIRAEGHHITLSEKKNFSLENKIIGKQNIRTHKQDSLMSAHRDECTMCSLQHNSSVVL